MEFLIRAHRSYLAGEVWQFFPHKTSNPNVARKIVVAKVAAASELRTLYFWGTGGAAPALGAQLTRLALRAVQLAAKIALASDSSP